MLVGIISDTHDSVPGMEKGLEVFLKHKVELVLHCGDWITPNTIMYFSQRCAELELPLQGVFGNNDTVASALMKDELMFGGEAFIVDGVLELKAGGRKLAVCHGHEKNILSNVVQSGKYDAVFTGHTHKVKVTQFADTVVVNPGSTAFEMPRTIQNITTVALYNTKDNSADVVELE